MKIVKLKRRHIGFYPICLLVIKSSQQLSNRYLCSALPYFYDIDTSVNNRRIAIVPATYINLQDHLAVYGINLSPSLSG